MDAAMDRFLRPEIVWVLVPVVALLVWGVVEITHSIIRHRERISMIEQGMDPDRRSGSSGSSEERADEAA